MLVEFTICGLTKNFLRFEVPVAVNIKVMTFLEVTPCSLVDSHEYFRRNYCLDFQNRRGL
jgi:hypothetical protein